MSRTPKVRFKGFEEPWKLSRLGDIASSFAYGLNAAAKEYDGKHKYLRITDIDDVSHVFRADDLTSPDTDILSAGSYQLQDGDILFARTGASVGKTYIYRPSDGVVYYAGFLIRAKVRPEHSDEFIFQSTLGTEYRDYIKITSQRSGQPGVNAQEYSDYTLFVPNLKEQQTIGRFLRNLDTLIEQNQSEVDRLRNLKKAMLLKMFPQKGSKVPEIRFKGFSGDWETKKLGNMASFSKGAGYSKSDLAESGVPVVLYGRMYTNYRTVITDVDTFAEPKSGAVYSRGGEVVVPASGETAEDISIASVISRPGIILGGDLNVITPSAELDPVFLALAISFGSAHNEMAMRAQGASIFHLHNSDLMTINLMFPEKDEQLVIGQYFQNLDSLIEQRQNNAERLKHLKQAMLQRMFI